jgi:hypothetical protein
MDSITHYTQLVKNLLSEYSKIPAANAPNVSYEVIFDLERNRYLLLAMGWSQGQRVYHPVIHIDIIDYQVWIQANNTDRLIAEELVEAGIPHRAIVLGLQPPEVRPYTVYGVATTELQPESLIMS